MEYVYAALLLHKLSQPVTEANLTKVIASTGIQVDEAKVKTLIASLQGLDIEAELANAGNIAVGAGAPAQAAEKKEEKKEEKPSESAAGLSALFG